MRNFSAIEVKRSIRNFDSAAQDIINSGYNTYRARIKRFMEILREDQIINSIVNPIFDIEIDFEEIHGPNDEEWIQELKIPTDIDHQLAYVLKVFDLEVKGELSLENLSWRIYINKKIWSNIESYISEVIQPCLRELSYRLNDLIVDEVEGKEEILGASLQIFNYGSISASQGSSVAIGKDIQQTTNYKNVANEILEKIKAENIVPEEKLPEIEQISKDIEVEMNNENPSQSKLKDFASRLYDIGQKGVLKITNTVIKDPRWGQAVADTFIDMM